MNLKLVRKTFTEQSTIGDLSVNGKQECFTLEDKVRAVKIHGKTAIPAGIYEVAITFSDKFKKPLPLLLNVPNFAGVRIHSGNTAADTEGCILVGTTKGKDVVGNSRVAFKALFAKIEAALKKEKVFIEIVGGTHEDVAHAAVAEGAEQPSDKASE
ncbi:MAG TPA: DUF5675 family protein [Blastocatellia bacterium]|jgi:hypothetical protein